MINVLNRHINTLFKIDIKIQSVLVLFLYFTTVSLSMILSGYTFLGSNDGLNLLTFLVDGESRTLIMSYPLSILISTLYDKVPHVQWYSITIFMYMSVISVLFSIYITKLKDKHLQIILILLSTVILIHAWLGITITLMTLLLIVLAVPLIRDHQIAFWSLILLASFLRINMMVSLLPLLGIIYLLLFNKESLTIKKVITILILLSAVLFNNFSPSLDHDYKEWLQYTKARAYFIDLNGIDKKDILSEDEKIISYTWWVQDEVLLPTEKVIQSSGSSINAITDRVTNLNIKDILGIFYRHKLFIFLVLLTIYIVFKEQKNRDRILYLLFSIGLLTLPIIRDVDRVTFPLVFLWSILIFLKLLKEQKITLLKSFLLIAALVLLVELPVSRVIHYQDRENFKNEFLDLANKHPMKYEIPYSFPRDYDSNLGKVLNQNHFFNEHQWISVYNDKLLLPSWIIRHPYFYKSYDISTKDEKRKYKTYYEFLMDENTGFIGSKRSNSLTNSTILKMYNKYYSVKKNCCHTVKIIDESEHFSITQIIEKCEK